MSMLRRLRPAKPLHSNIYFVTAMAVILLVTTLIPAPALQAQNAKAASQSTAQPAPKAERQEITAERTAEKKVFRNPDGTHTAEISQFPIHYQDEQGKWQDIDTSVKDVGDEVKAEKTVPKSAFKEKTDDQGTVGSLSVAGRTVTLKVKNAKDIQNKVGKPEKYGMLYENVYDDTNLRYQAGSAGLKEDIILSANKGPSQYQYELTADNTDVRKTQAGDLEFIEPGTGNFLFKLPKPYMYDNSNAPTSERQVSEDVSYDVAKTGNAFAITLKANKQWLKDPARKYPITIDPTVSLNQPYYDAYVDTCTPTTPHYSEVWMLGGTNTGCTRRSYVWFNNLPALPAGSTITAADLKLFQYEVGDPNSTAIIQKVNVGWNATTLTWNNQPSFGNPSKTFADGNVNNNFVNPDVKDIVNSWYGGQANNGFMLSMSPESGAGSSTRTWRTGNYTADPNQYPKLTITYTAPYSAEFVSVSQPPASVAPGEQFATTFKYKNTGTNTWYPDGTNPIRLGTLLPQDRNSPFYTDDGHWQTQNRVKLDQQLVRPGETGSFTFTMTAPATTGTYNEDWGIVADGYSWLEYPFGIDVNVVAKTYGSAWQGQGWQGGGPSLSLARGQSALVWVDIKNTGNTTWKRDGSIPVRLGGSTSGGGVDRSSAFVTIGDWLSSTRPTATDKDRVAPNETARFSFVVNVPANQPPGTYNEYFRPVMDGVTWLNDQGIYIPITVTSGTVPTVNNFGDVSYATSVGGVNVTNGNLNLSANDVNLAARGLPLKINRSYNSQSVETGVLGKGWQFDFEQRLIFEGNNIRWISPDGQQFTYIGDGNGNFTPPANTKVTLTKSDPLLGSVTYTIKDKNNLKVVFDDDGHLKEVADRNGNKVTYSYTNSKLTTISDPSGRNTALTYNADNKLQSITDFANRTVSYTYTNGLLSSFTDARNNVTTLTYDANQRLAEARDARNNTMKYEYDTSNRVIRITDPKEANQPTPKSTLFTYNSSTQTSVTDTKDVITQYGFDAPGRVTSIANASVTPNTVKYRAFDKDFNMVSVTDQVGGQKNYEYDGAGNVIRSTDELGNVSTTTYDANFNNPLEITNPKNVKQKFEYDLNGNKIKEWADYTSQPTQFAQYEYDSNGNQTKITDPNGHETQYEYDSYGRIMKEKLPPSTNWKITQYTYDAAGNKLTATDPENHVTAFEYNPNNQVTKQIDPLNNITEYVYDANGNRIAEKDPKNQVTTYQFDELNQLTKTISPNASKTSEYSYDKTGNLTQVRDGNNQSSTISYDFEGKPIAETSNGVTTSLTYNAAGGLTQIKEGTTGNQTTTDVVLDKAGQSVKETTTGQAATNVTYDSIGNQTRATNLGTGNTSAEFNGRNLAIKETDTAYRDSTAQYDANGNVTSITLPSGKIITYTYDQTSQLTGISVDVVLNGINQNVVNPVVKTGSQSATESTAIEYDKSGNATKITKANGTFSEMTYDSAGHITGTTNKNEIGGIISSFTYSYDANGNVTSATGDGTSTTYTYDNLDELLSASDSQGHLWSYAYDAAGNRTQLTDGSGTTTYSFNDPNDKNRLTSSTKGGITTSYSYDPRGNNTGRSDGTTITYDTSNLITSAKVGSGPLVTYSYDTNKRIVARTTNNVTTRYQYDGDRVSAETDVTGTILVAYSYDQKGQLISQTRKDVTNPSGSNKTYYYHYDNHGSVTSLTDPAGSVVKSYTYDPYGNVLSETGEIGLTNNYTYSGYWQDQTTKLFMLKARAYDPTIGRFLTIDPNPSNDDFKQDNVLSTNYYLYTSNNPISRIDPLGMGFLSAIKKAVNAVVNTVTAVVKTVVTVVTRVVVAIVRVVTAVFRRVVKYVPPPVRTAAIRVVNVVARPPAGVKQAGDPLRYLPADKILKGIESTRDQIASHRAKIAQKMVGAGASAVETSYAVRGWLNEIQKFQNNIAKAQMELIRRGINNLGKGVGPMPIFVIPPGLNIPGSPGMAA